MIVIHIDGTQACIYNPGQNGSGSYGNERALHISQSPRTRASIYIYLYIYIEIERERDYDELKVKILNY